MNGVQLAPSAFLASAAASSDLIHHIIPPHLQSSPIPNLDDARAQWSQGHNLSPPEGSAQWHQKAWDTPKVAEIAVNLLENAPDARSRARLLAASTREAGAWLNALPISSLGLRMDDDTIRLAIGLRLGSSLCRPHVCAHCGAEVDSLATHCLSCRWSEGRHHRHAALNDILHRALTSAHVPSRLEPSGAMAFTVPMVSVRMALQWFHGIMESCSFGMRPARTLLLPPTSQVLLARPEQWLLWRRSGRKKHNYMLTWIPLTPSPQWP